jgi:hypothetical protein
MPEAGNAGQPPAAEVERRRPDLSQPAAAPVAPAEPQPAKPRASRAKKPRAKRQRRRPDPDPVRRPRRAAVPAPSRLQRSVDRLACLLFALVLIRHAEVLK